MKNVQKPRAFVYPRFKPDEGKNSNPYVENVCESLSDFMTISNANDYTYFESKDLVKHSQCDIFFFNWIEEIYRFRGGKVRVVLFVLVLSLLKLFGKKIVWTLHNKQTHHQKSKWRDFLVRFMIKKSDLILTHSTEGIQYLNQNYANLSFRAKYICHPIREIDFETKQSTQKFDVLIWGAITPYKGVAEFLEQTKEAKLSVAIVGKCLNKAYLERIEKAITPNVFFRNEFIGIEEIAEIAQQAKAILFTYQPESVLSSGSLMDSIAMKRVVIGPSTGAFLDLKKEKLVQTYTEYNEIVTCLAESSTPEISTFDAFIERNSWATFGKQVSKLVSQ